MGNIILKRKQTVTGGGSLSIAGLTVQPSKSSDFTAIANSIYEVTTSCKMTLPNSPTVNDKIYFYLSSTLDFDITSIDKINSAVLGSDYIYRITQAGLFIPLTYSGSTNGWTCDSRDSSFFNPIYIGSGLLFTYSSDRDTNDIVYYLGATKYSSSFVNPYTRGEILVSSSSNSGSNVSSKVLDRLNIWNQDVWVSNGGSGQFLKFTFVNHTAIITRIVIWGASTYWLGDAGSCTFQGSNDGTAWTSLATFTPNGGNNATWVSSVFENTTAFSEYRFTFATTLPIVFGDIQMYGTLL